MFKIGNLVLYKNQAAIVKECGEKYTIVYALGSQKVREKDICFLHQGPLSSLNELESADAGENTELNVKFDEVWELLQDEAEPSYTLSALAELALGDFDVKRAALIYAALTKHPKFAALPLQAPEQPRFALRSAEEAQREIEKQSEKQREKEERAAFIERLRRKKLLLPQDGIFMGEVEALALGKTDKSKVMQEAGFSVSEEKAHKLLLDCGLWTIYRNPHPSRRGLSMQSAHERLPPFPEDETGRISVEHTAYAIDNSWSCDPDDAIAFDGTYVWVHIADPAAAVMSDSPIDRAARNRGATLYTPEGASRMLAEESLADYALGLAEEKDPSAFSRALSFRIKLNDTGAVEQADVLKTRVKVERLTYEEADAQKSSPELAPLFAIAQKNIERRKQAGAVFIDLPEIHISLAVSPTEGGAQDAAIPQEKAQEQDESDSKPVVQIKAAVHCESASLVREFMLLAGEAAARFAFKNRIPFPYVCQEKPEIPRDIPEGLAGQYRLRRCMKSRSVSISPAPHAGLGLGMYSQVTSPLRRYSDLIAHQQLHAFLDGRPLLDKDTMLERISAGDAAAGAAVKAERKSNLHWTLVYLLQNPDWQGEAVIAEIKGNQAVILIPSLAREALITLPAGKGLNDTLTVKAGDINIPELTETYIPVKEA
ncbi:RNB domain-containing ribonuclease [Treponema sp. OMZ 840]|uniref:ribonuclease catalytic domain-containing protein n=1 Tax=Treponema sp. OMZ 840 TaxID=244313 RepID=UPI003D8C64FE